MNAAQTLAEIQQCSGALNNVFGDAAGTKGNISYLQAVSLPLQIVDLFKSFAGQSCQVSPAQLQEATTVIDKLDEGAKRVLQARGTYPSFAVAAAEAIDLKIGTLRNDLLFVKHDCK